MGVSGPVYVGLGSNLDDPPRQLDAALAALRRHPLFQIEAVSAYYRSAPVGPPGQPDYCNAVARLRAAIDPGATLELLLATERAMGRLRVAGERWGPRRIDLDLLAHGGRVVERPGLSLPHPRAAERAFVLVPWAEVAHSGCALPQGELTALAAAIDRSGLRLWAD